MQLTVSTLRKSKKRKVIKYETTDIISFERPEYLQSLYDFHHVSFLDRNVLYASG